MKITVLSGGVGGARFLRGLRDLVAESEESHELTAVVNVSDDLWLTGLRICPDLDSVMYTLAGENDEERGWGRVGETERVSGELRAYGVGWPWFTLGDLDIGTHLTRSHYLREGLGLTEATRLITSRWPLGVTLLPATEAEVETHVLLEGGSMHFQEWWTKHRAALPARGFEYWGREASRPAPGVLEAIDNADVILVAPSNPVVSIAPILAIPGISEHLASTSAPVVGISPIIAGSVVRGMADACLTAIGVETSADGVALNYGSSLLDGWLIDESDAGVSSTIEQAGIATSVVPLWMRTRETSSALARNALALAEVLAAR